MAPETGSLLNWPARAMLGGLTALAAVLTVGLILLAVTSAPGTAGFRPAQLFLSSSGVSTTTSISAPSSPTARIDRWLRADHSSLTRLQALIGIEKFQLTHHLLGEISRIRSHSSGVAALLVRHCQRLVYSLFNGEYERQQHRPRRVAASLGNDRNGALPPTEASVASMIRCMRQQAFPASHLPRAPLR